MADRCITSATSTVYATRTVLNRVPSITATATYLTVRPVVQLSTYIGTIRGQITETVFRVPGEETVTATSELAGFATQTVVTSSPLSILYTTICPTATSSSTTTTTTTTTTPTPTTSSTLSTTSSSTTTPPPSSTRLTTVTVPFSSSSTSSSSSATALAGSSGSSSGGSSHIGAIVGGAVGGAAALIILGLAGWWFAKKGGRNNKDDYDPFARDEHWDPALGGAGAGALDAGRTNTLSRHGANPRSSKYAEAGYGAAAAGVGALGYAAAHERSRSRDSSGEGEKDGFPSYAPLPTDGSPQRVKRKVAPAAEQDAYYANIPYYPSAHDDGMTTASVGTGAAAAAAAGAGALGAASMYDRHHYQQQAAPQLPELALDRDEYRGATPGGPAAANSPSSPSPAQQPQPGYAMSPPPQHNTAGVGAYPSMYDQRAQGQAFGQPGGYMQYPSSASPPPGAPSYPTMYAGAAQPSYPPQQQQQQGSLPYPGTIDYNATQQRDVAPPPSLVPGHGSPSPAPSYRSIQHGDDQQQQRSSPLRVVNEDEEQPHHGAEGDVDAYGGLDEGLAYLASDRR